MKWNKNQLNIALALSQGGKTNRQIAAEFGCYESYVSKVKKAWLKEKPDLSPEAIEVAPEPVLPALHKKKEEEKPDTTTKKTGKPSKGDHSANVEGIPMGLLKYAPVQFTCQYTPIMYMAKLAAINQFGWPSEQTFEEFIDIVLYHFFLDRGVVLQAYVVLPEQKKDGQEEEEGQEEKLEEVASV